MFFSLNSARKAANALAKEFLPWSRKFQILLRLLYAVSRPARFFLKTSRVRSGKRSTALYN